MSAPTSSARQERPLPFLHLPVYGDGTASSEQIIAKSEAGGAILRRRHLRGSSLLAGESDAALVARARQDRRAFAALYDRDQEAGFQASLPRASGFRVKRCANQGRMYRS